MSMSPEYARQMAQKMDQTNPSNAAQGIISGNVLGGRQNGQLDSHLPEVRAQIECLNAECAEIGCLINAVEERFHVALQPEPPEKESCDSRIYRTQLGGDLGSLVERFAAARRHLLSIIERAQL